jgi:hypothetical protein
MKLEISLPELLVGIAGASFLYSFFNRFGEEVGTWIRSFFRRRKRC